MGHMLIGVDGSKAAGQALAWASVLSLATGDDVHVLHAERRPYAEIPPSTQERLLAERTDLVEREWMRPAHAVGVTPKVMVIEGDPRMNLVTSAEEEDASLVVVGRSGAGGEPGFLHLGSVVEHAAHHTTRPLAVIPSDAGTAVRRILLGVDGSEGSAAAVDWCAHVAKDVGATVIAAVVEEPVAEWTPAWDDHNWRREAEREVSAWIAPIRDAGVAIETAVIDQIHPADGLLAAAAEHEADLLVVGTRGAGGFLGLRFGGVAMKVLHRAELPVVLVPPRS